MNQRNNYCVLVVDDHHMMRLGLKTFSQIQSAFTVQLLEAANLADAFEKFREHSRIDLVLLDLHLPDSHGLQSVQRFLNEFPKARIVVYSATADEFVVRQALALGAIAYIPKSISADSMLVLLESLLTIERDTTNEGLSGTLSPREEMQNGAVGRSLHARDVRLTPTQLKVLELLLAGLSNREIASECKLALGTVKNAVSTIMLVMNVTSRSHLMSLFR